MNRDLYLSAITLVLVVVAFVVDWQGAGIMFLAWWADNIKGD